MNKIRSDEGELSMKRTWRRIFPRVVVVVALTLFAGSPALAVHTYAPDGGSHVWDSNYKDRLNVTDSKCDSRYAYGNWNRSDSNRLNNQSGCYTTVYKSSLGISSHRACTNYNAWPDSCSSWKNT